MTKARRERRKRKKKGIDIYPTCGPLQLFNCGCAYDDMASINPTN